MMRQVVDKPNTFILVQLVEIAQHGVKLKKRDTAQHVGQRWI